MVYVIIGLLILVVALIVIVVGYYNNFINLRNRVTNAWAQIDVQLKRRADLIPNLVETVKGYAGHESRTLTNVVAARQAVVDAKTPEQSAEAENMLSGALRQIFALAEAYPDLKANQNFMQLQGQLEEAENKISYMRQSYNDVVMMYNTAISQFPGVIVANLTNFKEAQSFETAGADRETPAVDFSGLQA